MSGRQAVVVCCVYSTFPSGTVILQFLLVQRGCCARVITRPVSVFAITLKRLCDRETLREKYFLLEGTNV